MTKEKMMQTLLPQDSEKLCSLLQEEDHNYRRLLRLAWRQNSYMRRQDVDRLEKNAAEWQKYLPHANSARVRREQYVGELGVKFGLGSTVTSPRKLLDYATADIRQNVKEAVRSLLSTTTKLAHQNELNRNLADFCLDLAREEATIFKQCVLNDPSGRYGEDARSQSAGPGGVLIKQA